VGVLRPFPIRGELIIFIISNITIIVSTTVPCLSLSLLPWPRADLFPSPECLTIFGIFDPSTWTMPAPKRFTWPICVPTPRHGKCATNPYKSTLDVSSPTAIDSRQRGGMVVCSLLQRSERTHVKSLWVLHQLLQPQWSFSSLLTPRLKARVRFPSGK